MFAVRDLWFTNITCFPKLCVWFYERQEVKEGVGRESSDLEIPSLEKTMAPYSSTLAWKIPWMEEPGGLQSMGSLGVRHD